MSARREFPTVRCVGSAEPPLAMVGKGEAPPLTTPRSPASVNKLLISYRAAKAWQVIHQQVDSQGTGEHGGRANHTAPQARYIPTAQTRSTMMVDGRNDPRVPAAKRRDGLWMWRMPRCTSASGALAQVTGWCCRWTVAQPREMAFGRAAPFPTIGRQAGIS